MQEEIRIDEAVLRGVNITRPGMVAHSKPFDEQLLVELAEELRRRGKMDPRRSEGSHRHNQQPEATGAGMRWTAFVEIYCETHEARHPGEHSRNVRRVLDRFTQYRNLAEKLAGEVTPLDLEQYVTQRRGDRHQGRPLSHRTINNEINILNTALAKAGPRGSSKRERRNFGYIETPPGIDTLPEMRKNPVELTELQQQAFLKALFDQSPAPRPEVCDRRQFYLGLFLLESVAPLRRASLLNIPRPADLTERLTLTLPPDHGINKTLVERTFAVPREIAEVLSQLPTEPGGRLLPWVKPNGKPYSANYLSDCIRLAQRRAGIPEESRVLLKHFRSTVATLACSEYGDAVGKQLLGHSAATNTINTNYKRNGTGAADRRAAEELGRRAMEIADIQPDLKIASEG